MDYNQFLKAFHTLLWLEGGYVYDYHDRGGETKFGVTERVFERYKKEMGMPWNHGIEDISLYEAQLIYQDWYFRAPKFDKLPSEFSYFCFIGGVNIGTFPMTVLLQNTLDVKPDGVIGPITEAAAKRKCTVENLMILARELRDYYQRLSQFPRYGRGWLKRIDYTLYRIGKDVE